MYVCVPKLHQAHMRPGGCATAGFEILPDASKFACPQHIRPINMHSQRHCANSIVKISFSKSPPCPSSCQSGGLDVGFELPVLRSEHRLSQCRCTLCHVQLFSLDSHGRHARIRFELAGPDLWPLRVGTSAASRNLQMPRSIVSDQEARDTLEPIYLEAGMVLVGTHLRKAVRLG